MKGCRAESWVRTAETTWGRDLIGVSARLAGVAETEVWQRSLDTIDQVESVEGCPDLDAHERAMARRGRPRG